jgi:hypothetical protein
MSCDFLFLWVGSIGVAAWRGGGLLLRQSMTCLLFVRLVALLLLHRYRLTQYIRKARMTALSCTTWYLLVAWLMISRGELLDSPGVSL